MSETTHEGEDGFITLDQVDSPLVDEGSSGASGGGVLKKGPWTSAEDAILIDYVKKHGEGNWNAVQKHSGLSRCGKSCRLRWANHLRPNLKKGAFTPDEEKLIIELHAKMGNKWARMAAHLPGRTDNEIKNYWNTRIKRCQRAGLPLYPAEVCFQAMQEDQQNQSSDGIHCGDERHYDLLHTNRYDITDTTFDGFKANQGVLPYVSGLDDIPGDSLLMKGLGAYPYDNLFPTMHYLKCLRESTPSYYHYSGNRRSVLPLFGQIQDDAYEKILRSFGFSFLCDTEPGNISPLPFDVSHGCHPYTNGKFFSSKPADGAVKLELPSFQYSDTEFSSWGIFSSPQLLESVDNVIQSPPAGTVQSDCGSPRNSGLLDALLHEAKTISGGKNQSSDKSSNSSVVFGDAADSSNHDVSNTEWEDNHESTLPLRHSAAAMISESTLVSISGNSAVEHSPEVLASQQCHVKSELSGQLGTKYVNDTSTKLDFLRPDALLGSSWLLQRPIFSTDKACLTNAIVNVLGDELRDECKEMSAESSRSSQGCGLSAYTWNNMPAVCQLSELPGDCRLHQK